MAYTNGQTKTPAPPALLDDGDMIESLMREHYLDLIEIAFDDADKIPGIDVAFDLDNPYVQDMVDLLAHNVRAVAETTRQAIAETITAAAAEGLSTDETARRLRAIGFTESITRSRTIARTESASAYTGGSLTAYQISGVVTSTEWLTGTDPCDICIALDGATAAIGREFLPGVVGPPAHPNCTCVLSPVVEG